MKMVQCHVKYTILRGQLETCFELMELVISFFFFFILHFKCNLSRCAEREGIENRVIQLKALNACRVPESNASRWHRVTWCDGARAEHTEPFSSHLHWLPSVCVGGGEKLFSFFPFLFPVSEIGQEKQGKISLGPSCQTQPSFHQILQLFL